jgi:hypothetical protein
MRGSDRPGNDWGGYVKQPCRHGGDLMIAMLRATGAAAPKAKTAPPSIDYVKLIAWIGAVVIPWFVVIELLRAVFR